MVLLNASQEVSVTVCGELGLGSIPRMLMGECTRMSHDVVGAGSGGYSVLDKSSKSCTLDFNCNSHGFPMQHSNSGVEMHLWACHARHIPAGVPH